MARDPGPAARRGWRSVCPGCATRSEPRSLPWRRRAGKCQCGETSRNAPSVKKDTHTLHGQQADTPRTPHGVPRNRTSSFTHSLVRLSPHSTARASTERVESHDIALAQLSLSKEVWLRLHPLPPRMSLRRRTTHGVPLSFSSVPGGRKSCLRGSSVRVTCRLLPTLLPGVRPRHCGRACYCSRVFLRLSLRLCRDVSLFLLEQFRHGSRTLVLTASLKFEYRGLTARVIIVTGHCSSGSLN